MSYQRYYDVACIIGRIFSIIVAIFKWFMWKFIEATFIRIYVTRIFNNIIVIFIDVKWIKYLHIMMPTGCGSMDCDVVLIHFMNSLSPSTWLNGRILSIQSLQKQLPLDREVSKSSNKSPEQLQYTYAWHEWHSIFFECCCFLPLHVHTHEGHVLWYTIIKKKCYEQIVRQWASQT